MTDVFRTPDARFADLPGFAYEPHYVDVDGLRLHHLDEGSGPTVLCFHGEPSWSFLYRHMLDVLVAAGNRVVCPDMPGRGRSEWLEDASSYAFPFYLSVLGALYAAATRGLPTLADSGYEGAGHGVHTPVKKPADGHQLHVDNRAYNMLLRSTRCLGERGFALLTQRWRVLQGVTTPPRKIGDIAKAALVLTHFEHGYLSC